MVYMVYINGINSKLTTHQIFTLEHAALIVALQVQVTIS